MRQRLPAAPRPGVTPRARGARGGGTRGEETCREHHGEGPRGAGGSEEVSRPPLRALGGSGFAARRARGSRARRRHMQPSCADAALGGGGACSGCASLTFSSRRREEPGAATASESELRVGAQRRCKPRG